MTVRPKKTPKRFQKKGPDIKPKKERKKYKHLSPKYKKDSEDTLDYTHYTTAVVMLSLIIFAIYIIYSLIDNVVESLVVQSALNKALSTGYEYARYITYHPSEFNFLFYYIIFMGGFFFLLKKIYINNDYEGIVLSILKTMRLILFISIPILFFIYVNYESVDKVMYKPIQNLYNIANEDKSFKNTALEIKFKKALDEKDYETLKTISNDIKSIAKLTPERFAEIDEVITSLSIPEIKSDFNTFKNSYRSYTSYDKFYNNSIDRLGSTLDTNSELRYLIKKLEITNYDYEKIKTIIKQ